MRHGLADCAAVWHVAAGAGYGRALYLSVCLRPARAGGQTGEKKGGINMRLDKYLKVSRIIKRRTVAKEAGAGGRVSINGKTAKPAAEGKEGDVIEIRFGEKLARLRVLSVAETVRKNEASAMYEMLEGEEME